MIAPSTWTALHARDLPQLATDELRLCWSADTELDDAGEAGEADESAPGDRAAAAPSRRVRTDALLRAVLAPVAGRAPAQLEFGREAHGRPFLVQPGAADFNLSDTTGGTLVAVSSAARVGVDLERHARRPPVQRLAARWFSAAEAAQLAALPAEAARLGFLHLWTAKEASCKATGTGIFGYLPRWVFDASQDAPRLLAAPEDAGAAARWSFLRLAPSPAHTAVIALRDARSALCVTGYRLLRPRP